MHAVTLQIPLTDQAAGSDLLELEDQLASALRRAKAGKVDGNEVGQESWTVFMHGRSANAIFEAIKPILKCSPYSDGATVVKQFGGPNAEEHTRRLWRGRFRVTQRARKPGKRPRIGDVLEFDCSGGIGHAHAVHRETSGGMRGMWVVSILKGVRKPGSEPNLRREICRLWIPLGSATSQGFMRIIGNEEPTSQETPPIMIVSFDLVRACVEHGRSLYDYDYWESYWGSKR